MTNELKDVCKECSDICPKGWNHCPIREVLVDCIESSSTALDILKERGVGTIRKLQVATVIKNKLVKPGPNFPASDACVKYGRAIADYISPLSEVEDEHTRQPREGC